jgi:hypothetical protein
VGRVQVSGAGRDVGVQVAKDCVFPELIKNVFWYEIGNESPPDGAKPLARTVAMPLGQVAHAPIWMVPVARQFDPAVGCACAVNDQPGGGVMVICTVDPGAKPSAVMVTCPGAFTVDGLAETPWPKQLCAFAELTNPENGPALEKLWLARARVSSAAQIAQRRAMVHSFTSAGADVVSLIGDAEPVY